MAQGRGSSTSAWINARRRSWSLIIRAGSPDCRGQHVARLPNELDADDDHPNPKCGVRQKPKPGRPEEPGDRESQAGSYRASQRPTIRVNSTTQPQNTA